MRVRSLTLFALSTAITSPALAQSAASLVWNAPRGCPTRDEVIARARAAGLRDAETPWSAEATVRHPRGGPWRLEMVIVVSGDRVPAPRSAPTCADLAQVAGVDLALVINAHAEPPPAPPPAAPPPPPPSLPSPVPAPLLPERDLEPVGPSRDPVVARVRGWGVTAGVLLATDVGALPRGNVGVGVRVGVAWRAAVIAVSALYFPAVATAGGEGPFRDRPEGAAQVGAWSVSARGCGRLTSGAWSADGCLGVEMGVRRVRGAVGVQDATAAQDVWVGPLVGVEGAWRPLRWLRVGVGVDASMPLPTLPFVRVENLGVVLDGWGARVVPRASVEVVL